LIDQTFGFISGKVHVLFFQYEMRETELLKPIAQNCLFLLTRGVGKGGFGG